MTDDHIEEMCNAIDKFAESAKMYVRYTRNIDDPFGAIMCVNGARYNVKVNKRREHDRHKTNGVISEKEQL